MKSNFHFKIEKEPVKKHILIPIIIMIFLITGYVKCIIHFANYDFKKSYKAEIIYGIGAVTGIGTIIGWFDFGK